MRKLVCSILFLLILTPVGAFAGMDGPLVLTSEWLPPSLSSADVQAPELLVLRVAQEEVGYREGPRRDESKYGDWFGKRRTAWCSEFVTWCVHQADVRFGTRMLGDLYPRSGYSGDSARFYINAGRFISDTGRLPTNELQWYLKTNEYVAKHSYIPYPGDLVWFCYHKRGETDHIAIVEGASVDERGSIQVHVIEGNNPDSVQRKVYALNDKTIFGFGTPVQRVMTNMRLYNKNHNVRRLRDSLAKIGLQVQGSNNLDEFTKETRRQVVAFQKAHGIKATGVVDMETWLAVEAAVNEAANMPPSTP